MPADDEELALTLNGKKKRLTLKDFNTALKTSSVDEVVRDRMVRKFGKARSALEYLIDKSFISPRSHPTHSPKKRAIPDYRDSPFALRCRADAYWWATTRAL